MLIEEYFTVIERNILSCPFVHKYNLTVDKRSLYIGFIEGTIRFIDNSTLHFMEFTDVSRGIEKYKYSYNYEAVKNEASFRYDMAPHYRDIETYPHHKHSGDKVTASKEPSLKNILFDIEKILLSNFK